MNKKNRVTSYDVAHAAGVSQSAVSRVYRPGVSVSKKTREKVLKAAEELGYKPNAIARMLINQSTGMIAVIISSINALTLSPALCCWGLEQGGDNTARWF